MNLFNIGVEGQYRVAAFFAGALAARRHAWLPAPLHVAVHHRGRDGRRRAVGVDRRRCSRCTGGVSEVISTIMLNCDRRRPGRHLLLNERWGVEEPGAQIKTTADPADERPGCPSLPLISGTDTEVCGFIVVAVGPRRRVLVRARRTRFGFDLRATGSNPSRRGRQRRQRQAHGDHARCCSPAPSPGWSACPAARREPHLHGDLRPASASPASPSPCSAATTRSASPSARSCGVPRRSAAHPRPRRRSPRRSSDHAGHHRPVGRHRLRARPPASRRREQQRRRRGRRPRRHRRPAQRRRRQ